MTLILNNAEIAELMEIGPLIDAMDEAYRGYAAGRGLNRRRSDTVAATGREGVLYGLKSMDGVSPDLGVGAVRINSDVITHPRIDGAVRRKKVPAAPGERFTGLVLLFSTETGEPLAIFPDGVVQRYRVAAANGLAHRALAPEGPLEVGMIGSGWQAGTQAMAICATRPVTRIRVWSPNEDNRRAFCAEISSRLGVDMEPVESPEAAMAGAQVALCATSSLEPVFRDAWARPGMHLSTVKRAEIEAAAMRRADRLVIHSRDAAPFLTLSVDADAPDVDKPVSGAMLSDFDFTTLPTLADLVAGSVEGRTSPDQMTCFVNNIGMGLQFAIAGRVLLDRAKAAGAGRELPTEWFTQKEHP